MLFEDAVFFPQVLDDLKLVAIHPARKGHEQDPQPDGVDHGPSLLVRAFASTRLSTRLSFWIARAVL
jgi:hypothetical protein